VRWFAISAFIWVACGREDPALDIVRLPQTAYGPFDAAAAATVATDAGPEAGPHLIAPKIGCWLPDEPADDEEEMARAPFDNCPLHHEGGRFDEPSTARRRAHHRDICCYANMRTPKTRVREID
jgi:hypothetical protein